MAAETNMALAPGHAANGAAETDFSKKFLAHGWAQPAP
jgi:hypothetical protein